MKKFVKLAAAVLSAAMVLGSALTVSAAVSTSTVSATATDVSAVVAKTADGKTVTVSTVTETVVTEAQKAAVALVGQSASLNAGTVQVEKVFELTAEINGPTDITMEVPGITAGQKIAVLHQKADGTWESVPVKSVAAGSVTATFTSLSPVAIVSYASPKTGESVPAAAIVVIIAFTGAALCMKKFVI